MKAIAIVGSPRRNGNSELLAKHALRALQEEGIGTELVTLSDLDIRACNACGTCEKEERCAINDDLFPLYLKMKQADSIIFSSIFYIICES